MPEEPQQNIQQDANQGGGEAKAGTVSAAIDTTKGRSVLGGPEGIRERMQKHMEARQQASQPTEKPQPKEPKEKPQAQEKHEKPQPKEKPSSQARSDPNSLPIEATTNGVAAPIGMAPAPSRVTLPERTG